MTTTYATRSPLQLVPTNSTSHYYPHHHHPHPHHPRAKMSGNGPEPTRRGARRSSARLMEKEKEDAATATAASAATTGYNAAQTGRGKRKHEYDEEDDGFTFTRTRSKRTKAASAVKIPEPVAEEARPDPSKSMPVRKSRKKSTERGADAAAAAPEQRDDEAPQRRRSARNSGDRIAIANSSPKLVVSKRRAKDNNDNTGERRTEANGGHAEERGKRSERHAETAQTPVNGGREPSADVTKIALPFADTPIMRRNKEMRKGGDDSRRSSLGMRGRRASSLIDSGTSNALPHSEVESSEFYKHIESGLPEPRRMKQLLTWCGTRALGDKPSFATVDSHAKLAAREIQQQLLNDFSTKSEMSDWFAREDQAPNPQPLKPNPKNTANLSKIAELEQKLARLQSERQTWDYLLNPLQLKQQPQKPPIPAPLTSVPSASTLSATATTLQTHPPSSNALALLLQNPPSQSSHSIPSSLPSENTTTTGATSTAAAASVLSRLSTLTSSLEFETDKLADSVHTLSQYRQVSERVGWGVLRSCADFLEERERRAMAAVESEKRDGDGGERHERESGKRDNKRKEDGMRGGKREGGHGYGDGGVESGSAPLPAPAVGTRDVLRALSRVVER